MSGTQWTRRRKMQIQTHYAKREGERCSKYTCVCIHVFASGPKTVLVKRTFLLACVRRSWRGGWGGGHVSVPCTSSATCCDAVQMSGSVASLYTWRGGVWGWSLKKQSTVEWRKISCHTGTIDAAWSAVKNFIPNSLCSKSKDLLLYVKCWQWRYANLHTHLQQKTISTLKRLLWKEKEKACQHAPMKWIQNRHVTKRKFCQWNNSACRNVCLAVRKWDILDIFFLTSAVSGPPGCFWYTCTIMRIHACLCACIQAHASTHTQTLTRTCIYRHARACGHAQYIMNDI